MPSKRLVATAPLLAGVFLAGAAARQILEAGLTSWLVPSFIGGCATAIVGLEALISGRGATAGVAGVKQTTKLILLGLAGCSILVALSLVVV
ncbi:MAG: hypothetical protein ABEH65_06710 [Halobacteriales archaeon]